MDTAKLELAAQRYRDAQQALDAALTDLQTETAFLLGDVDEREVRAQVSRITGWTPRQIRPLMKAARQQAVVPRE